MPFPTPANVGSELVGVDGFSRINAHFADRSQHLAPVQTIAALKALSPSAGDVTAGDVKAVQGYSTSNRKGGGLFTFEAAPTKACTVSPTTDLFTSALHGFYTGQPVRVYGTTLPGGIANSTTTYYA